MKITVGKLTRVTTEDGRTYIGTLTGYAEVSKGEDQLEEIYLSGCSDHLTMIQLTNVRAMEQQDPSFEFTPRA